MKGNSLYNGLLESWGFWPHVLDFRVDTFEKHLHQAKSRVTFLRGPRVPKFYFQLHDLL